MASDVSKTRAVVPGRAILGDKEAAKVEHATLGGAVVPGPMIIGAEAAERAQREAQAALVAAAKNADPKAKAGPKPRAPRKEEAKPAVLAKAPKDVLVPASPAIGESAEQAVAQLQADPDAWDTVMRLEVARPDGVRPQVAQAVLDLVDVMVDPPGDDVLEALRQAAQPAGV